jgi:hypothetical protein
VIAYLDCSTGVSGDKFLGALVDAGFDIRLLRHALADMGLPAVEVAIGRRTSHGFSVVGVTVTEPGAPRRSWATLRPLIEDADLPDPVRARAIAALLALAEAEARVHGVAVEDVHFHEIGAADTIADVVGVVLGLHHLGIEHLTASPVAVGSGTVATEHGVLPVPAPATTLLLEDTPVVAGTATGELTTPTGAALLRACADVSGPLPAMTLRLVGTGCGTRDIGQPNVCRLLLGEPLVEALGHEGVTVLETNIDHLTPEELAVAAQRLRDAGALDVWQTSILMKKDRAGVLLSARAPDDVAAGLAERMIAETGTLGVRMLPASRRLVERDVTEVVTSLGTARFKVAVLPDGTRALRVESDDAARIAAERSEPVHVTTRALEAEATRFLGVQPMRQRPSSATARPSD